MLALFLLQSLHQYSCLSFLAENINLTDRGVHCGTRTESLTRSGPGLGLEALRTLSGVRPTNSHGNTTTKQQQETRLYFNVRMRLLVLQGDVVSWLKL